MITLLKKASDDAFFRNSAISFSMSMVAGALSYLFHPILARLLTLEDYGEVQVLLSLYSNIVVIISVFSLAVVNIVANSDDHDHGDSVRRTRLVTMLRNMVFMLAMILFAVMVLMSGALASFFRFESIAPILILAFTFPATIPLAFRRAYLRGTQRFFELGVSQVIDNAVRVAFAGLLAYAGFRAGGAMASILVAQAAAFVYAYMRTREGSRYAKGVGMGWRDPTVREELRFSAIILGVTLSAAFFTVGDMLIVKRYFDPATVGLYGGVATVARIAYYVTGPVAAVLVPSVKLRAPKVENTVVLLKALGLILAMSGAVAAVFALFPSFTVRLLVGERFLDHARMLVPLSALMVVTALVIPVLSYHLALRQRFVAFVGVAGVAAIIVMCAVDHGSVEAVVRNFTVGQSFVLVALVVRSLLVNRRHHAGL